MKQKRPARISDRFKSLLGNEIFQGTALLVVLLLLFFWQSLFTGRALLATDLVFELDPLWQPLAPEGFTNPKNHALSDQVFQYYMWKEFASQSLNEGKIPLWNPYLNGGHPFVGNAQSAVFEPFNVISYFFSVTNSFVVVAFLRLLVAGFFTLVFAREIGISKYGSFLAMVSFTFSGFLISFLSVPLTSVIVWLPAILFLSERIINRRSFGYALLLSIAFGFQFLAGHPATSAHLILVSAGYSVFRISIRYKRDFHRQLQVGLALVGSLLLGLLLGAVQLLPAIAAISESDVLASRSSAQTTSLMGLLFPVRSWIGGITVVLPDYFGNPINDNFWHPGPENYLSLNAYVGILPLALGIALLLYVIRYRDHLNGQNDQWHITKFFIFLAIISFGISYRLPIFNLVDHLPVLSIINNNRLRVIFVFSVALLAGYGLDIFITRYWHASFQEEQKGVFRLLSSTIGTIMLVSFLVILTSYVGLSVFEEQIIQLGRGRVADVQGNPFFHEPPEYYHNLVETRFQQMLDNFHPKNYKMYMSLLVGFVFFVTHKAFSKSLNHNKVLTVTVLALTITDLFLIGYRFNPAIPPEQVYPLPEIVDYLKQEDQTIYRVVGLNLALVPNSAMVFGLQDVRGYEPVSSRRYMGLVSRLEGNFRAIHTSLFTQASSELFDLLNVKYAISQQPLGEKWEPVHTDSNQMTLYRNPDVLPRAYLIHQAEYVADEQQALSRVLDPSFDFRQRVILEHGQVSDTSGGLTPDIVSEDVHLVRYRPNTVELEVQARADGFLVLSDNYGSGWHAYLNGMPVEIMVANYAFRAIAIPAGTHKVDFVYEPLSFRLGVFFSGLGALAIILLTTLYLTKKIPGFPIER